MPTKEEITAIFPDMIGTFQPEKAAGVDAMIQFNLIGDNGGMYWVKVKDQSAEYGEGDVNDPSMTLTMSADDFHALIEGQLNPMQAFMSGKLKVDDTAMGMKLISMFNIG